MAPGRKIAGRDEVRSTTVDSIPTRQSPPSNIRSTSSAQFAANVLCGRGADAIGAVGAGGGDGAGEFFQKVQSDGMIGATDGDGRQTGGDGWERSCSDLGRTNVSGPGQEARARSSAESGQAVTYRLATEMSATWTISGLVGGPAFDGKDFADGAGVGRIGAEAVDGFRGEGDESSGPENFNGSFDLSH